MLASFIFTAIHFFLDVSESGFNFKVRRISIFSKGTPLHTTTPSRLTPSHAISSHPTSLHHITSFSLPLYIHVVHFQLHIKARDLIDTKTCCSPYFYRHLSSFIAYTNNYHWQMYTPIWLKLILKYNNCWSFLSCLKRLKHPYIFFSECIAYITNSSLTSALQPNEQPSNTAPTIPLMLTTSKMTFLLPLSTQSQLPMHPTLQINFPPPSDPFSTSMPQLKPKQLSKDPTLHGLTPKFSKPSGNAVDLSDVGVAGSLPLTAKNSEPNVIQSDPSFPKPNPHFCPIW